MTLITETQKSTRQKLTAQDRCDTCGAQAYVAAEVQGTELLYCSHHANKYEDRLISVSSKWHDERKRLDSLV